MKITARGALGAFALTMFMMSAHAQSAPNDAGNGPNVQAPRPPMPHGHDGGPEGFGPHGPGFPPAFAVMHTVEEIAELYRDGGHAEQVLPFLRETLSQTHDPMLRKQLREAIAEEQLKPADTSGAIATLRDQLHEDIAALDAHAKPRKEAK